MDCELLPHRLACISVWRQACGQPILTPEAFHAELKRLYDMEDGWLNGEGVAPPSEVVDSFGRWVIATKPDCVSYPHAYPTEDGVQGEWSVGAWEISVELQQHDHAVFIALNCETDECHEFEFCADDRGTTALMWSIVEACHA